MSLAGELYWHADNLLNGADDPPDAVTLRRSISASYYALFHWINQDATNLIAPNVNVETNHRIQRWFDHARMKEICGRFLKPKLEQPLLSLVGGSTSADLKTVCGTFIALQDARHDADYDPGYLVDFTEALRLLRSLAEAIAAWERIKGTSEANIFILSLLLWKNWEKDR